MFLSAFSLAAFYGKVLASPLLIGERQSTSTGTGPYAPAKYTQDPSLPNHTLFVPKTIPPTTTLPVLLWGEGGCSSNSLESAPFLIQLASHGILVIASGTPKGTGSTTSALMTAGTDWIKTKAGTGNYSKIDASRIIAAGWSCGGIEAYAQFWDERVESLGIWSSGLLSNYSMAGLLTKPMFYFLGGEKDIAYVNGERDYKAIPAGTPKWKGNLPVGHGGTYTELNGGKFGIAGGHWVDWLLRGNSSAESYFTGSGAKDDGWTVEFSDLEKISVTPI